MIKKWCSILTFLRSFIQCFDYCKAFDKCFFRSWHDWQFKKLCKTNQCRRKACRNADKPSMISRMATVSPAKAAKITERAKNPPPLREDSPRCITMDQSTSDSSAINSNSNESLHHNISVLEKNFQQHTYDSLFETPSLFSICPFLSEHV